MGMFAYAAFLRDKRCSKCSVQQVAHRRVPMRSRTGSADPSRLAYVPTIFPFFFLSETRMRRARHHSRTPRDVCVCVCVVCVCVCVVCVWCVWCVCGVCMFVFFISAAARPGARPSRHFFCFVYVGGLLSPAAASLVHTNNKRAAAPTKKEGIRPHQPRQRFFFCAVQPYPKRTHQAKKKKERKPKKKKQNARGRALLLLAMGREQGSGWNGAARL